MRPSMHEDLEYQYLLAADTQTAAVNSLHVDMQQYESVELVAGFGDFGNTLGASPEVSWDVILQHADDDGAGSPNTWAAVTAAKDVDVGANGNVAAPDGSGVIATLDNDGDADKLLRVGYLGDKRHVRLRFVANNTPGATDLFVLAVLKPLLRPAADQAAKINL